MADSTAAMMLDRGTLAAFSSTGEIRWRVALPGGSYLLAPPRVAPGGLVMLSTNVGIIGVSPAGHIDWRG